VIKPMRAAHLTAAVATPVLAPAAK